MQVICISPIGSANQPATGMPVDFNQFSVPQVGSIYTIVNILEKAWGTYFVLGEFNPNHHFNSKCFAVISNLDETEIHSDYIQQITPITNRKIVNGYLIHPSF